MQHWYELLLTPVGQLTIAAFGLLLVTIVLQRVLRRVSAKLANGLVRLTLTAGMVWIVILAARFLNAPARVIETLVVALRVYVIVGLGLIAIRSSISIVGAIERLAHRQAAARGWQRHYEEVRPLLPTFRMCLEYALWVALIALAIWQIESLSRLAGWGPKLIEVIGVFFLGRVAVELARHEVDRRMLAPDDLDEMTRRRRATIAPLVRSALSYAIYFGTAVLVLAALGFNPMPFLAGAGVLGLVIGFGAQSLINDVVSGFFILFENIYLVGDSIEAAGARGVVEAIEFRTTKIRDIGGRLHIVRNGDVKQVINYSKDYTIAIVPVDVSYDADLRSVFSILREAGYRLHRENADVLADTEID